MNMVSWIFRGLAIVAAAGAGGIGYVTMGKVDNITEEKKAAVEAHKQTRSQLQAVEQDRKILETDLQGKEDDLRDLRRKQDATTSKLKQAKADAASAEQELSSKLNEFNDMEQQVASLKKELVAAQSMAASSDIDEDEYNAKKELVIELEDKLTRLENEKSLLKKENDKLKAEKKKTMLASSDAKGEVKGRKATIVDIRPDLGLIVLSEGSAKGLRTDMELAIRKSGRSILYVKVAKSEPNRSVANILPGFGFPQLLAPNDAVEILAR